MSILSLDVSAASTGWCYTEDGETFEKGLIKTPAKLTRGARLQYFGEQLEKLFKQLKPTHVVQEDTFSGINVKTLKILSEFAGVAKLLCFDTLSYEAYIISNHTVKSFFKAKTKEQLFNFVCCIYEYEGLTFKKDNDMIDAQAQLLCYADAILEKYKYRFEKEYGFEYLEESK